MAETLVLIFALGCLTPWAILVWLGIMTALIKAFSPGRRR